MHKPALTAALFALTAGVLVAPPAAAADLPAPTVNITAGQTLSEVEPLLVTGLDASALSVLVTYAGQQLAPLPVVGNPDDGFTATGEIDTWGLAGNNKSLVVVQCVDAEATDCGASDPISTKVDNPNPTHDLSRPGTEFKDPFDLTVHLAYTSGTPRIRLTTDGGAPAYVDPEDVTPVNTDALAEGPHQIAIAVCAADDSPCTSGETVSFDVIRSVHGAFSVSAPAFSPNGAGLPDTIDFEYTRSDPWDSAMVEVRAAGTAPVLFHAAVPIPEAPATDGSFTYDGKDDLAAFLPDGDYTATLSVSRTLDSGDTASSTLPPGAFTVDSTALAPVTLTPSFTTFYPYVDGYRDATKLSYTSREPYSRVDFVVRNAADTVVRTKLISVATDASWNGRDDAGVRVPEGSYTVVLRVIDALGNIGFSPPATVRVNDAKLVTITRDITVTPKASRVGGQVGACSALRTPSVHGWAGSTSYLSNTKCRRTFKASIAWTHNRVHLPSAVKYRWVRLGWFGGPTRAASHNRASAALYAPDYSTPQGWFRSLDYLAGQYLPTVPASQVLNDGYVHWGFQTGSGNRYDVKSFTITYRADVLR
jgi:flagellar hook assembly protein FlgD